MIQVSIHKPGVEQVPGTDRVNYIDGNGIRVSDQIILASQRAVRTEFDGDEFTFVCKLFCSKFDII